MPPVTVAALGSSFAAGQGIDPVANVAAGRSKKNYAHQLADRIGADLVDLTVSGATTANILDTPQRMFDGTVFPPQLSGLPGTADVVTVTAGGNDLGFIGTMLYLALSKADPGSPMLPMLAPHAVTGALPGVTSDAAHRTIMGLVSIVRQARSAAPRARIVLVDYLTILDPESAAGLERLFTPAEVARLLLTQTTLQQAFAEAAEQSGAELVCVSALSTGHALGSNEPWVQAFHAEPLRIGSSFHPNEAGMTVIAAELERLLSA